MGEQLKLRQALLFFPVFPKQRPRRSSADVQEDKAPYPMESGAQTATRRGSRRQGSLGDVPENASTRYRGSLTCLSPHTSRNTCTSPAPAAISATGQARAPQRPALDQRQGSSEALPLTFLSSLPAGAPEPSPAGRPGGGEDEPSRPASPALLPRSHVELHGGCLRPPRVSVACYTEPGHGFNRNGYAHSLGLT